MAGFPHEWAHPWPQLEQFGQAAAIVPPSHKRCRGRYRSPGWREDIAFHAVAQRMAGRVVLMDWFCWENLRKMAGF